MSRATRAILGAFIGLGIGCAVGGVAMLVLTVSGWPGAGGDPSARARHLAEAISEGLHVAFLTSAALVPTCIFVFARRKRTTTPRP